MSRRMRKAAGNNLIHRQQAERKIRSIQRDAAKPAENDGMVIFFRRAGFIQERTMSMKYWWKRDRWKAPDEMR